MKRIPSFIIIIILLSAFVFSMSACDKDENENGKMQDLLGNSTLIRIDCFETSTIETSEMSKCSTENDLNRTKMWFITTDVKGKTYTRTQADSDFAAFKYSFLEIE